jgi:hypothetical protein
VRLPFVRRALRGACALTRRQSLKDPLEPVQSPASAMYPSNGDGTVRSDVARAGCGAEDCVDEPVLNSTSRVFGDEALIAAH